jgi:hypothetical protein
MTLGLRIQKNITTTKPHHVCLGLSEPAPTGAPSKKIPFWDFMDGMKLSPKGQFTWSVDISFFCSFFSQLDFSP